MTEKWGVFYQGNDKCVYLVAVESSQDEAIERAWELDREVAERHDYTTGLPNLHRVERIPDELAFEAALQLSEGKAVLVETP
jgi:hypothetical protein